MAERRISEQEVDKVFEGYHTHYHDRDGNDILLDILQEGALKW
jgi:hypothetical protein